MKTFFIFLLLVASIAPLTVEAAPIQLSNNTRIEIVQSLTTRELWNTTKPSSVEAANIVVDSRMFDSEAKPKDGKWRGCALVMIGTGDVGIQPVAVRVWTVRTCDLSIEAGVSSKPQPRSEFNMRLDSKEMLKIQVTSDLKVTMGGKVVGQIKD